MTHKRSVGLLWTRDWPVAEAYTCTAHDTHNRQTTTGIRTSNPSRRAVAGLCLIPHGHRNWHMPNSER